MSSYQVYKDKALQNPEVKKFAPVLCSFLMSVIPIL